MPKFKDGQGRIIDIEVNDCDAVAYFNGREVGRIVTTGRVEIDDRTPWSPAVITGMHVASSYQRAGIGMEMVRQLRARLGKLLPASRNEGRGNQNALTDAGEALTRAAQDRDYIYPFPEDRPDDD